MEHRTVDAAAVDRLRAGMRGTVITPDDESYEDARQTWNAAADRRPALIARCSGVADVIRALDFARSEELVVAVRGGGHSIPGFSTCEGGIVIDLGPMKGVLVDPAARTVQAQGGVTWGEFDRETQQFGLATTGGVVSTTGIAGLTLGGGKGWLMRRCGLASDNLLAADVVTADGGLVRASAEDDPDLHWALRGGGGNFGIATALRYRLHEVGPVVTGGPVFYDATHSRTVFRYFRELTSAAPDELSVQTALMGGPEGLPVSVIAACHSNGVEAGEKLLAPARTLAEPLLDGLGPVPYVVLQSGLDEAFGPGVFHYATSRALNEISDAVIELLVGRWQSSPPGPVPGIFIEHMGGAVGALPADATAYGHRDARYEVLIMAHWTDPAKGQQHVDWVRALAAELDPHTLGGGYVNYMDECGEDGVRASYRDHYTRLQALKKRYDPDNVFRLNQNIVPSGGSS
jgi:FAD/FMN-containing dehydrogenase